MLTGNLLPDERVAYRARMNPSWRLQPWNNPGQTVFDVTIDASATTLVVGACGLLLRFPYEFKTYGEFADPGGHNAHILSLEGWCGHESDGQALSLRIPSQIVVPNGHALMVPVTREQLASLDAKRGTEGQRLHVLLSGTARIPRPAERDAAAVNQHGVLTEAGIPGRSRNDRNTR
jgi:hypothetical protein